MWQRPLSGVYTIMMEKFAKDGDGGDARPPPFTLFTITYKVAVNAQAETLTYLISTPKYSMIWPLSWSVYTTTLYVMGAGGGRASPPLPDWANFSIVMEYTPESGN